MSELLADKSIYNITSLATRFRAFHVFCGFTAAFMIKMLMAVVLGQVIAELPRFVVAIASTTTFFFTAIVIWFKRSDGGSRQQEYESYFSRAALITFAAILFSEWGDVGQLMAATLTARYGLPVLVWFGATLALVRKGLLALALGRGLRNHIPLRMLRPVSVSLCVILGIVSAFWQMFEA